MTFVNLFPAASKITIIMRIMQVNLGFFLPEVSEAVEVNVVAEAIIVWRSFFGEKFRIC